MLLADRVVVDVEADLRAGLHQLAGVLAEHVADLADGELAEVAAGAGHVDRAVLLFLLDQVGDDVVHDAAPLQIGRISIPCTQRSSVRPVSTTGCHH